MAERQTFELEAFGERGQQPELFSTSMTAPEIVGPSRRQRFVNASKKSTEALKERASTIFSSTIHSVERHAGAIIDQLGEKIREHERQAGDRFSAIDLDVIASNLRRRKREENNVLRTEEERFVELRKPTHSLLSSFKREAPPIQDAPTLQATSTILAIASPSPATVVASRSATSIDPSWPAWRQTVKQIISTKLFKYFILTMIVINAVTLGIETSFYFRSLFHLPLVIINTICIATFVVEIILKIAADRLRYFRSGWNLFDFTILALSLAPNVGPLQALYSVRCLRIVRVFTMMTSLRLVVVAFSEALPSISAIFAMQTIIVYVGAIMTTSMYGDTFPVWFGSMGRSSFTLFQILTLESWSMGIVRPVMDVFPHAWMFFVPYVMLSSWTILNLFIGVIVTTIADVSKRRAGN